MKAQKGKKGEARTLGGFTIIEVVLVLAIAGLIFLMVFVALPALQSSQRDTQRRNDMARVATAITQYQTNNNGSLPKTGGGANFKTNYLDGDNFKDPDGSSYTVNIYDNSELGRHESTSLDYKVNIYKKAMCKTGDEGEGAKQTERTNDFAVVFKLEGSGTYCTDNQ